MDSLNAILGHIRSGSFLTAERLQAWAAMLLAGFAIAIAIMFATAHGVQDYKGRPLGTDFSNVYAAGTLAREGLPDAPFDPKRQYTEEKTLFGAATPFYGWHYPPFFLLIAAPLAAVGYLPALIIWQIGTLALYLASLALLIGTGSSPRLVRNPRWILLALAFPAVFVNLTHGHNGFLTAALLGGGLALLDKRPTIAGVLFGLLAYKPQFAFMIPLVLVATGRWRVLASGVVTVLGLAAVVTSYFGVGVWPAFIASTHFTRTAVLEDGATGFQKIQSVFACVRMWGGSVGLAYAVQLVTSVIVAVLLVRLWRGGASFADKVGAMCLAALLTTPYCLDYDMMALAPAIAVLAVQGIGRGFRPYEKVALAVLWFAPIVSRSLAAETLIPLGVISMVGMLARLAIPDYSNDVRADPIAYRPDLEKA